ncbi:MAG: hypothetical protein CME38_13815 [Haliea sp.]|nr:hypothetical protein [Haliea sp.]
MLLIIHHNCLMTMLQDLTLRLKLFSVCPKLIHPIRLCPNQNQKLVVMALFCNKVLNLVFHRLLLLFLFLQTALIW